MGDIMKRFITTILLAGLAALNTACAEETGPAKETTVVAKNTGTTARETSTTAKSTGVTSKETGTTRSAVDLMATPYRDAKPAGQLPANTTVDILERRGGWLRISAPGKTGWARVHQVRAGEGPEARKSGEGPALPND